MVRKPHKNKELKQVKNDRKENNISFKVTTSVNKLENTDSSQWEIVHRKTKRWDELGFGDGELFPGYGKLYNREFEVWYCDVGSKERKDIQKYSDKYPLNYQPNKHNKIVGNDIYLEQLQNTKGYEQLYSGLDKKNRKRWYFALVKKTPTLIETKG